MILRALPRSLSLANLKRACQCRAVAAKLSRTFSRATIRRESGIIALLVPTTDASLCSKRGLTLLLT